MDNTSLPSVAAYSLSVKIRFKRGTRPSQYTSRLPAMAERMR